MDRYLAELLVGGRFRLDSWIRGHEGIGCASLTEVASGRRLLGTFSNPHSQDSPALMERFELAIPGITPLIYAGRAGVEWAGDILLEEEPPGAPIANIVRGPLPEDAVKRLGRALINIVKHAALGTLRPELIYVDPRTFEITAIAPRCEAFIQCARRIDMGIHPMFSAYYHSATVYQGGTATAADDVFSLAIMLAEWLTGGHPFARTDVTHHIVAVLGGSLTTPLPAGPLFEVIARALSPNSANRPSLAELEAAL